MKTMLYSTWKKRISGFLLFVIWFIADIPFMMSYLPGLPVVPEKLRTLDHDRPWSDDQFASTRLSSNRDMSR